MENNKIGAMWLKKSKGGQSFMSGVIDINGENVSIVVFKNGYKKEDKHPDYIIYKSEPYGGEKKSNKPVRNDEDIPF